MINIFLQCLFWVGLSAAIAATLRLIIPKKNDRRRCRKCRYDMSGTAGMQCPECGQVATHERRLRFAPRRKAHALLIVVLALMSYSGAAGQRAIVGGWTAAIPSTLLIAAYPVIESNLNRRMPATSNHRLAIIYGQSGIPTAVSPGTLFDQSWSELAIRARGGRQQLAPWQRNWLMKQAIARGRKSDGMLQALGGWQAMNKQQRDEYLQNTVQGIIKAREITALQAPMFIEVGQPGALADFETEITPAINGCQPAHRKTMADYETIPVMLRVGAPHAQANGYAIDVQIRDRNSDYTWSGRVETGARAQGDLDTLLPKKNPDQFKQWLKTDAKPTLHLVKLDYCMGPSSLSLSMSMIVPRHQAAGSTLNPAPAETEGMVLDAQVELLADDQMIGKTRVRLVREPLADGGAWRQVDLRRVTAKVRVDKFWDAVESGQQIQVRLKPSEPSLALSAFDGTSRWSGDITMPIDQLIAYDYNRSFSASANQTISPLALRTTNFSSDCRLDEPVARSE